MTDKLKLKVVFELFDVKTKEVEEHLYAAGRRYTFDKEGCIDKIIDYGSWGK